MQSKTYYPDLGTVMSTGNLRIPTAGLTDDGERVDGYEEIDAKHPKYNEWFELINQRGPLLEALRANREKRKEERRAKLENKS
jgi:hypothetical protein